MRLMVDRTCTEIGVDDANRVRLGESKPLAEFRSTPVLVLLGDPGAGKTTEFERESGALDESGERSVYVKARDFLSLDLDSHPEWRHSVLFIDGLDEIRSGLVDARVPLDEVRGRLDRLRPSGFRISCREADWLGHNDRQSLELVSPDSSITVVRLDPLDDNAVRRILAFELPDAEIPGFIDAARLSGIWYLLENPLTLQLVVDAISRGGGWPKNKRDTFEMACERLAIERNPEHLLAAPSQPAADVMDAAGYLCALQLLAGLEGYSLRKRPRNPPFWALGDLDGAASLISMDRLEQALATRLFTADDETGFLPVHRQVAEFLGGRYLAKLISNGLSARRVIAVMTGPSDGRVVTALRGLSAWLAAHSDEARGLLVRADPVGVGLYGDISGFSGDDRQRLLASLDAFALQGTLGYGYEDARAFRSLVSEDLVPAIEDLISRSGEEAPSDRFLEFVLRVLSTAEDADLGSLAALGPALEAILWSPSRPSQIRLAALEAYIRVVPPIESKTATLRAVLDAVHDRRLPDPDDQLAGTLLRHLYPDGLAPLDVWRYAGVRNNHRFFGRFWLFWNRALVQRSSPAQTAQLLDNLHDDSSEIVEVLQVSELEDVPVQLLAHGLETVGDGVDVSRLYQWLTATTTPVRGRPAARELADRVRTWLEARPQTQKAIVLRWLTLDDNPGQLTHRRSTGDVLHGSSLPADFGIWCLGQAISAATTNPELSKSLLEQSYDSLSDPRVSEGLTHDLIHSRVAGHPMLESQLRQPSTSLRSRASVADTSWRKEMDELKERRLEETKKRRDDWARHLRAQETELRANTFPPQNLRYLALVYLQEQDNAIYSAAPDRIEHLTGNDPCLIEAVMVALRNALWRDDVPDLNETIALHAQRKTPCLALPVLASMGLLVRETESAPRISTTQMRRALAIYYNCGALWSETRACHDAWFQHDPGLVLDVLYRCAVAALRNGEEALPGVHELDRLPGHDGLVSDTRIRLLDTFTTRIPQTQLSLLDDLLAKTLDHADNAGLKALVDKKLSMRSMTVAQRVRWMTAKAVLRGGRHTRQFRDYVGANRRVRHLAEFLHNTSTRRADEPIPWGNRDSDLLVSLVELLGRSYRPKDLDGLVTVEIGTSELIGSLIRQLSAAPDPDAHQGLAKLVIDPRLQNWHYQLTWAKEKQRIVYRDASYRHPDIIQAQSTLSNQTPANAADLAALLCDRLVGIGDHIRGDSTNPWRQFWNEDPYGRPDRDKPEDSCRDALLDTLKQRLPRGVDATPEGRYAADKRADIRTSCAGFNVPIEIKKNSHRELWSALRSQLINQYTTDPTTSGYGIYLVLWFGVDRTTKPPSGKRPSTPDELAIHLQEELTTDEARKITVLVIDITKPNPAPRILSPLTRGQ